MPKIIHYTNAALDRLDIRRNDPDWIAGEMTDEKTLVLPVRNDRNLLRANAHPAMQALQGEGARNVLDKADEVVLLGLDDDKSLFAADISSASEEEADLLIGDDSEFVDLRQVPGALPQGDGAVLAYARGILYWHRRHRYCGDCGHPTESADGGHVRRCTNPDCAHSHFPRTDPAVIMLVMRPGPNGGACLLAHKSGFLPGMYSTLAGFVEPGETLEEAVAREVMEEAAVAVTDVRYRASQPWPFPASLMLGFRAVATSFDIERNPAELDDAAWFTRDDIARMAETGKRLPRPDSIALWLIEEWLEESEN
jgi:NAD+ diphosphatase